MPPKSEKFASAPAVIVSAPLTFTKSAAPVGLIDARAVVTHRYPLEQLDQALNDTRDRPGNFVKGVVLL